MGALSVRRQDGTTVAHRAWRTSKTRDLLRILAVNAGKPVPTDRLLEMLWPEAEPTKGRASLRTAVSHIRKIIGKDCVTRRFDALVLQHAWVDAATFSCLAVEARGLLARGSLGEGLVAAQEAAALYADDLCADEPYAEWALADRERLRTLRLTLLAEAADAALALGRHRTAVHLAGRVIECDPTAERAYRILMRGHFCLGETDGALRSYAHCRQAMAVELGAEPSQETRALHLELLSKEADENLLVALTGRDTELRTVRARVAEALREGQAALVVVSGSEDSGRTRLADEVCAPWSDHLVRVRPTAGPGEPTTLAARLCVRLRPQPNDETPAGGRTPGALVGALAEAVVAAAPLVVRLDDLHGADPSSVTVLCDILADLARPVVVVATSAPLGDGASELARVVNGLALRGRALEVSIGPLTREAVADLLDQLLTERAAPDLLEFVMAKTGGRPGQVVRLVRRLSTAGRLTITHNGVDQLTEDLGARDAERVVQRARAALDPSQAPVFDAVSVLARDFTVGDVARTCTLARNDVRAVLDDLTDQRLLTADRGRYGFRHARLAEAAYRWLRPTVRRELHAAVAAGAAVSEAARIAHWEAAGEPQLACAAALLAAEEAGAKGNHEGQRSYVLQARSLADLSQAALGDRLALAEQLGDACYGMGRFDEARAAFAEAADLARAHAPGDVARLSRKLGNAASRQGQSAALGWYRQALMASSDDSIEQVRATNAIGSRLALHSPQAAEDVLRNAVGMADDAGDVGPQVEARVLLATSALAPMRRFFDSQRLLQEALAIADASEDATLLVHGLVAGKHPLIALSSSWQTVATLTRVEDLAGQTGDSDLVRDARLLLALAAHELAAADFSWRWKLGWLQATAVPLGGMWRWVPGRVLFERGQLAQAGEALAPGLQGAQAALSFQLVRLPAARLAAERGDTPGAVALLRAAADRAADTGVTLVLPEVAARLATLEAPDDTRAAQASLDQAEAALGEAVFPRERAAILLARAALLAADGQVQAAADMAGAAAGASQTAGLAFAHAEALTTQAGYLTAAGDRIRALAVLRRAGEIYDHAGAPARVRATSDLADRLGLDWGTGGRRRPATEPRAWRPAVFPSQQ